MTTQLEKIIISSLLNDGDYARKVLPHVQPMFFSTNEAATVVDMLLVYNEKYSTLPTKDALLVELESTKMLSTEAYTHANLLLEQVFKPEIVASVCDLDEVWRLDKTEKYFKQQSCHIAVLQSISILEGEDKKVAPEAIPGILEEALNISFDTDVGHDYFDDAEDRFDYYHRTDVRIPFLLTALNNVTNGGAVKKSLIVPVAPTGVGKSFFMTAWAAFLLKLGYNVLYITLELPEEKIGERIDANLMDIAINDLGTVPKDVFTNKINDLKRTHLGKLKIKEYPSSGFNALILKGLIGELKAKNKWKPDIVMIDYLNLVSPLSAINGSDTYNSLKNAAREIRSVAMELDIVTVAPTQTNREGVGAADYSLTEISESMGIAHYADMIFGLIETTELAENMQLRIKQLKNRWGDINKPSSFVISVNKAKMQMHDYDEVGSFNSQPVREKSFNMPLERNPTELLERLKQTSNYPSF